MTRATWEFAARTEAQRHGIDPELVLRVIQTESGWNPNAGSHKGARGLMQITPITAKDMGAKEVPMDPIENIRMGVGYLAKMLNRFEGDTHKALAAYNWGPSALARLGLEKAPAETRNYLDKIIGPGAWAAATGQSPAATPAPSPQPTTVAQAPTNRTTTMKYSDIAKQIHEEMFGPVPDPPAPVPTPAPAPAPANLDAPTSARMSGAATPGARPGQEAGVPPLSMQDLIDGSPFMQATSAFERAVSNAPFNVGRAVSGAVGADGIEQWFKQQQDRHNAWRDRNVALPRGTGAERAGGMAGDLVTGLSAGAGAGAGVGAGINALGKVPAAGRYITEFLRRVGVVGDDVGRSITSAGTAQPREGAVGAGQRVANMVGRMGAGGVNAAAGGAAIAPDSSAGANAAFGAAFPLIGSVARNVGQAGRNRFFVTPDEQAGKFLRQSVGPNIDIETIRAATRGPDGTIAGRMPFERVSDALDASGNAVGARALDDASAHLFGRDQNFRAKYLQAQQEQGARRWAALHEAGSANPSTANVRKPDIPTLKPDEVPVQSAVPEKIDDPVLGKLSDEAIEVTPNVAADDIPTTEVTRGGRDTIDEAMRNRARVYGVIEPHVEADMNTLVDPDALRNFLRGPASRRKPANWQSDAAGALDDIDSIMRRGESQTFHPPMATHPNGDSVAVPASVVREAQTTAREIRSGVHNKNKGVLTRPGKRVEDVARDAKDVAAGVLDQVSPAFREADEAFAAMSEPVDSARVMTLLGDAIRTSATDGVQAKEAVLKRIDKVLNDPQAARRLQDDARALLERLRTELKPQARRQQQATGLLSPEQHQRLRPPAGSTSETMIGTVVGGPKFTLARHLADLVTGGEARAKPVRDALTRAMLDDPAFLNTLLTSPGRPPVGFGPQGTITSILSRRVPNLIPSAGAENERRESAERRRKERGE